MTGRNTPGRPRGNPPAICRLSVLLTSQSERIVADAAFRPDISIEFTAAFSFIEGTIAT